MQDRFSTLVSEPVKSPGARNRSVPLEGFMPEATALGSLCSPFLFVLTKKRACSHAWPADVASRELWGWAGGRLLAATLVLH